MRIISSNMLFHLIISVALYLNNFIVNVLTRCQTTVTLIEVIAGFMPALNIDQQLHAVFFDRQQGWRHFARHWALSQLHSLFFTHGHVTAVVNSAFREQRLQGANQRGTLVFCTCAQELQHQEVAKAVNGHARQAVGLTGNQAIAVQTVTFCQPFTPLLSLLQAADKEVDVNGFIFIERPDASADLGRR